MSEDHEQSRQGENPGPAEQQDAAQAGAVKKPWKAPKVLSQEPLEAVAAACDVGGFFGKSGPPDCITLGS